MARRHLVFQNRKSILAAALVSLGLFIVLRNLVEAATLVRFFQVIGDQADATGPLAAVTIAARHFLQGYFFNHTEFLRALYEVLLSFSGMLLIAMGTVLFAPVFAAAGKES
jgi:hypothetical protein